MIGMKVFSATEKHRAKEVTTEVRIEYQASG